MFEFGTFLQLLAFVVALIVALKPAIIKGKQAVATVLAVSCFSVGMTMSVLSVKQDVKTEKPVTSRSLPAVVKDEGERSEAVAQVQRKDVDHEQAPPKFGPSKRSEQVMAANSEMQKSTTRPLTTKAPVKLPLFAHRPTSLLIPAGKIAEIEDVSCDARVRDKAINQVLKVGETMEIPATSETKRVISFMLLDRNVPQRVDGVASFGQGKGPRNSMSKCDLKYRII